MNPTITTELTLTATLRVFDQDGNPWRVFQGTSGPCNFVQVNSELNSCTTDEVAKALASVEKAKGEIRAGIEQQAEVHDGAS